MIVVDSSAIVAVLLDEPERDEFNNILIRTDELLVSSVAVVETRLVMHTRIGQKGVLGFQDLLQFYGFTVKAPGIEEADMAYAAFVKYGKGSGHPARLNLVDLFSYALAKSVDAPLLYKGNDFAQTDIVSAR